MHSRRGSKKPLSISLPISLSDDLCPGPDLFFLFGRNSGGELSRGHKQDLIVPTLVAPPVGTFLAHLAFGNENTVLLSTAREVYTAGSWVSGTQGDQDVRHDVLKFRKFAQVKGIPFIRLACGDQHCLATSVTGELYSWGGTLYGKLGTERKDDKNEVLPSGGYTAPKSNFRIIDVLLKKKIKEISCGREHSAVCSEDGEIFTFGSNKCGQLGFRDVQESTQPRRVCSGDINEFVRATKICCGDFFTLVISSECKLYSWGDNQFNQLGLTHTVTYQRIPAAAELVNEKGRLTAFAAGRGFALIATERGEVYSFGFGQQGQLGHGVCQNESKPRLIQALECFQIIQVAAGDRHALALADNGACFSWGCNDRGQLGTGGNTSSSVPVRIPKLIDYKIVQISAGCSHSLAMTFPFTDSGEMTQRVDESNQRSLLASASATVAQSINLGHRREKILIALEKLEEIRQIELAKYKTSLIEPEPEPLYTSFSKDVDNCLVAFGGVESSVSNPSFQVSSVQNQTIDEKSVDSVLISQNIEFADFLNKSDHLDMELIPMEDESLLNESKDGNFSTSMREKLSRHYDSPIFVSESPRIVALQTNESNASKPLAETEQLDSQVLRNSLTLTNKVETPRRPAHPSKSRNASVHLFSENFETNFADSFAQNSITSPFNANSVFSVKELSPSTNHEISAQQDFISPIKESNIIAPNVSSSISSMITPGPKLSSRVSSSQRESIQRRLMLTPSKPPSAGSTADESFSMASASKGEHCPVVDSFRSVHVNMVHRYVVFETDRVTSAKILDAPDILRALVDEYISFYSIQDRELLFHNFVSTGSNYSSSTMHSTPSKFSTPLSVLKSSRGVKHTLMFVSRYIPNFVSFPEWHQQFFAVFASYCSRVSFTEMLPPLPK